MDRLKTLFRYSDILAFIIWVSLMVPTLMTFPMWIMSFFSHGNGWWTIGLVMATIGCVVKNVALLLIALKLSKFLISMFNKIFNGKVR